MQSPCNEPKIQIDPDVGKAWLLNWQQKTMREAAAYMQNNKVVQVFITHCIPNLQLDSLVFDVDHARPKLDPNSEVMNRLKPFVGEL